MEASFGVDFHQPTQQFIIINPHPLKKQKTMSGERETMSAADCKAKGNEFLKTKDFDTAISWYTTAIEKDNTQHGGYKNCLVLVGFSLLWSCINTNTCPFFCLFFFFVSLPWPCCFFQCFTATVRRPTCKRVMLIRL